MSAKSKNQHIQCTSTEQLLSLKDEFENYAGRDTTYDLTTLSLTVLALPRKYKKKTVQENKARKARRDKESLFSDYDSDYSEYESYNA
jgi:hypothetical protein